MAVFVGDGDRLSEAEQ